MKVFEKIKSLFLLFGYEVKVEMNIRYSGAKFEVGDEVLIKSRDPNGFRLGPKFKKGIYFIATKHEIFENYKFPNGSVVIDPFRYVIYKDNIKYIPIGKNS